MMLLQLALGSVVYVLYLGFFLSNPISRGSIGVAKLALGLPIFLPALAYYFLAPIGNVFFPLIIAFFLYLAFFTGGDPMGKLVLGVPLFGPAILIYLFAPVYKALFAGLWIAAFSILFFVMLMIALRNLT